jgi:hypothetical protein
MASNQLVGRLVSLLIQARKASEDAVSSTGRAVNAGRS